MKRVCLLLKSLGLEEIHNTSTHIPLMKTHHVTSALQDTRDIWSLAWWQLSGTNSIRWVGRTNPWWTASYVPPSKLDRIAMDDFIPNVVYWSSVSP